MEVLCKYVPDMITANQELERNDASLVAESIEVISGWLDTWSVAHFDFLGFMEGALCC